MPQPLFSSPYSLHKQTARRVKWAVREADGRLDLLREETVKEKRYWPRANIDTDFSFVAAASDTDEKNGHLEGQSCPPHDLHSCRSLR